MSYLTDTEKRLLFSALRREKEVCKKIDDTKVEDASCKMLVPIINSLEKKFYYDKFEKTIRDKAIEDYKNALLKQEVVDKSVVRRIAEQIGDE